MAQQPAPPQQQPATNEMAAPSKPQTVDLFQDKLLGPCLSQLLVDASAHHTQFHAFASQLRDSETHLREQIKRYTKKQERLMEAQIQYDEQKRKVESVKSSQQNVI